MRQIRERLTYANVMSSIAVFLVLGGGAAVAASQLGKNTVGSKQLKRGAVTAAKIKKDAVTGAKVKAGSLSAADFAPGQLPAGPKGEKGEKGEKGAAGAQGPPGLSFGAFGNGSCSSLGNPFSTCASTGSVDLPSSGHVLLIASAEWDNDNPVVEDLPNSGECRLSVDGTSLPPVVTFGEQTDTHGVSEGGSISMNWITERLPAGPHSFAFECREVHGTVYNAEAMLSAVLLDNASLQVKLPLPPP